MPVAVIYVTAALLFIAVAPLPYGYYTLLRLVACVVFAFATYVAVQRRAPTLPWGLGLVALLFNPLWPVYLPREVWMVIDIGAGVLLLAVARRIRAPV
jgi:hypothetical protein